MTHPNQISAPFSSFWQAGYEGADHINHLRVWLTEQDILLAGRYSEWEYYNSDHAFLAGKKAAESVHKLQFQVPQTVLLD